MLTYWNISHYALNVLLPYFVKFGIFDFITSLAT